MLDAAPLALGILINSSASVMELPTELFKANALLIDGTWKQVFSVEPTELDGWVRIRTPADGPLKVFVRVDTIKGFKCNEEPTQPAVPRFNPWGTK